MNFFKKTDIKEETRKQRRELKAVQRSLGRDQADLKRQEEKLIADIQKAARQGNEAQAKALAKQLVRLRQQMNKSMSMSTQISGVSQRTQSIASNHAMAQAMAKSTKIMQAANKTMPVQQIQKNAMEFEKQQQMMDMREEIMNDTIDNALDNSEDEAEGAEIMAQVLDEIGLSIEQGSTAPQTRLTNAQDDRLSERSGAQLNRS